jgi:hypothetical protein
MRPGLLCAFVIISSLAAIDKATPAETRDFSCNPLTIRKESMPNCTQTPNGFVCYTHGRNCRWVVALYRQNSMLATSLLPNGKTCSTPQLDRNTDCVVIERDRKSECLAVANTCKWVDAVWGTSPPPTIQMPRPPMGIGGWPRRRWGRCPLGLPGPLGPNGCPIWWPGFGWPR